MSYPIGHDFSHEGRRWRCESHDRSGYWMVDTDDATQRRNISERAIGRTFHHQRAWRCSACAPAQEYTGHRAHPELASLIGEIYWSMERPSDLAGEEPPVEARCYDAGPVMVIVTDYNPSGAFDIYVPVALSSASPSEKIAALRRRCAEFTELIMSGQGSEPRRGETERDAEATCAALREYLATLGKTDADFEAWRRERASTGA